MTPQDFVHKWRTVQLKERSFYQEHFLDVCKLIGHSTPAETDKTGGSFTFEAATGRQSATPKRVGSGQGFADVWKQSFFAWEYKGKHADLDKAYDQLLQYRESLQNPPLLVVADAQLIRIHTNFTNSVKRVYELTLDDLLDPEKLALLKAVFFEPARLKAPETPEQVTEQAAKEFARLAELLRKWGEDPAQIGHFLIRLLFCLFAEDAGLLPKDLFTRLLARTRRNAPAFAAQLRQLFSAMSTGGWFGEHEILHFNGGLFDDDVVPNAFALELDSDGMDILHGVSGLDWSSIEPSILGTLFERSLDPGKRAQLGAHYTSRDDILLIVEPVLMVPLQRKWQTVAAEARDLRARAAATDHPPTRTKYTTDLTRLLQTFADDLRAIRILDPACGSGNFLYVALRQLLDLWKEVSNLAGELGLPLMMATSAPSPAQLYGLEINEYAHELAQATIWIGYIQWLRENGYGLPPAPILRKLDNIRRMDAILAFDAAGKPVEPEWPEADVVVGNPPFLGGNKIRAELGDAYVNTLFKHYEGRVPAFADLVCYWFERARAYIEQGKVKRAGLLATQAIRGGVNRSVLEKIKLQGEIFFAYSDRDWILDGATVHVSMIGFDNGNEETKFLDGRQVEKINPDLSSQTDVTQAKTLSENLKICFIGTKKAGDFDIDFETATMLLNSPINPNGFPNSDVVIPWLNGMALVGNNPNKWIIYFGELDIEEASLYEKPFEYVKANVYEYRQQNNERRAREKWWWHRRPAVEMWEAVRKLDRYIATPRVSKHRLFVWIPSDTITDDGVYVFARSDDYFFGMLQSKAHEIWSRQSGTQLRDAESGTRYTPTTTFETFPFPWPPGQEPQDDPRVQAIAVAARELHEKRERWLHPSPHPNPLPTGERGSDAPLSLEGRGVGGEGGRDKSRTLTNLYNQRPTWLSLAHEKLDRAVFAAYGWAWGLSEEEVLGRLLEENLRRANEK